MKSVFVGFLTGSDDRLVLAFCLLTTVLICWPILRYLFRTWIFRRESILGSMTGDAAVYYNLQFRPGAQVVLKHPIRSKSPKTDAFVFPQADRDAYFAAFKNDFSRWYGRRYFVVPLLMLVFATGTAARWAAFNLRHWAVAGGPGRDLRALTAASLAGAFVWIISDELDRLRRRDFTTSDVYYYVFRILLAIPFSWALAAVSLDGQVLGLPGAIPLAFFLGSFPTTTLSKIARRFASQTLKLGDDQATGALELEKLESVTKTNAERFAEEGVTTIGSLAYCDPVDLTIRTNLDFSYVVDCVSQSLAWIYFQDQSPKLWPLALRGAQEISSVVRWAADADKAELQTNARQTIADAATLLGMNEKSFRTTLSQIAYDPYSIFLSNVWTFTDVPSLPCSPDTKTSG